jgi:hypothetical protein
MILSLLLINYINTFNNISELTTNYINLYHPSIDQIKYKNYSIEKTFNNFNDNSINYNCKNYIEKNKAERCLEYNIKSWWCIYDNCISPYRRNNLLLFR